MTLGQRATDTAQATIHATPLTTDPLRSATLDERNVMSLLDTRNWTEHAPPTASRRLRRSIVALTIAFALPVAFTASPAAASASGGGGGGAAAAAPGPAGAAAAAPGPAGAAAAGAGGAAAAGAAAGGAAGAAEAHAAE